MKKNILITGGAGYIGRHNQGTGSGTGVCQGYGLNYEYKEK